MSKFKKLYLHKREAIRQAYSLLKDDRFGGIPYANFRGMMRFRSPRRKRLFTRLLFCALNRSETEAINLQVRVALRCLPRRTRVRARAGAPVACARLLIWPRTSHAPPCAGVLQFF